LLVSRTGFYVRPRNVIVPYFKGMTEAVEAANEKTDKVCLKTRALCCPGNRWFINSWTHCV